MYVRCFHSSAVRAMATTKNNIFTAVKERLNIKEQCVYSVKCYCLEMASSYHCYSKCWYIKKQLMSGLIMEKQVKLSVHSQVSCVMRISAFAYAKNNGADHLQST